MFLLRRATSQIVRRSTTDLLLKSRPISRIASPLTRTRSPLSAISFQRRFQSDDVEAHREAIADEGAESETATSEFPEETQRPAYEIGDQNAGQGSGQSQNRIRRPLAAERTPTKGVYVGNLFFSVTEQDLEREFQQFGKISNVRVIYDQKGLSKGLGFVEFENVESATEAVKTMDGVVLQGRPLYVQYTLKPQRNTIRPNTVMNPPGRTLFIGNLSFEMSDKDLQDLFQDVDGVENVRVAVDRRTGQPRGFCHVDFWDTEKATAGMDVLQGRQIFGRTIRLDYSTSPSRPSRNSPIETES